MENDNNRNIIFSDMAIQWHPAFCAAAELEFMANRKDLEFQREYNLSKKPLQIDLLVVEKRDDVTIENEIGRIFRKYNIIEYKSPGDGMTIDDFFKTVGYACIYKGLGGTVDSIPINQLTVSLFREGYPLELLRSLEHYGFVIKKKYAGIYYVEGLMIPAQIVVTGELEGEKHRSLRILSREALEEDIWGFVEDAEYLTDPGDRANVDAVLQVSVSANYDLYNAMKRRYPEMCEAMRRLMQDEIADELRKTEQRGEQRGAQKTKKEMALALAAHGMSIAEIAEIAKVSVQIVQAWLTGSAEPAR